MNSTPPITKRNRNRIVGYSLLIVILYLLVFGYLSYHPFGEWAMTPFIDSMLGVFMGAGTIAVITGIILVVQSVIEGERDKKKKVFDQKLSLYTNIIDEMKAFYRIKDGEETQIIDPDERMDLFFTQLRVALLSRPKTFQSYSKLINDIAEDDGVIKEDASRLLLEFIIDARDDLDVQEEMSPEDQAQFDEAIAIAQKEAEGIRKKGRGTYFVSEDPFQQYLDQYLTPEGRQSIGFTKKLVNQPIEESKLETIKRVHSFLLKSFEGLPGVSIDYTRTGGVSCFALGKKRGSKFCYVRFEVGNPEPGTGKDKTEVVVLYLLKSPSNTYQPASTNGLFCANSPHGYEFYRINLYKPEHFSDQVEKLVVESFETRTSGTETSERKPKKELLALFEDDWRKYCSG